MKDLDYVKFYAQKIKKDNLLFKQQKLLIESQVLSSSSLFHNMFSQGNFKEKARIYLRSVGLL